jgi:hypothetical protein
VPSTWHVKFGEFLLVVLFGLLAGTLLWASDDDRWLAAVLTAFIGYNIFGWWYLNRIIKPIMLKSQDRLREDLAYFDLEKLRVVWSYLTDPWQWQRFATMLAMVFFFDAICFSDAFRSTLAEILTVVESVKSDTMFNILPDFYLLFFVIVAENWIWVMRVKVGTALTILDVLKEKYDLRQRL